MHEIIRHASCLLARLNHQFFRVGQLDAGTVQMVLQAFLGDRGLVGGATGKGLEQFFNVGPDNLQILGKFIFAASQIRTHVNLSGD